MMNQLHQKIFRQRPIQYKQAYPQTSTKSNSAYVPSIEDFVGSFYAVLRRWESETRFVSNPDAKIAHPSFKALVENAGTVLSLIRDELSRRPSDLVYVLEDYFNVIPYPPEDIGNVRKKTDYWLSYLAEIR